MFNCYSHGWSHIERPCPLCNPVQVITTTSTNITPPQPAQNSQYDELKAAAIDVLPFLEMSTDPPKPVPAIMVSPADALRQRANEIEAKDKAIRKLRDIIYGHSLRNSLLVDGTSGDIKVTLT